MLRWERISSLVRKDWSIHDIIIVARLRANVGSSTSLALGWRSELPSDFLDRRSLCEAESDCRAWSAEEHQPAKSTVIHFSRIAQVSIRLVRIVKSASNFFCLSTTYTRFQSEVLPLERNGREWSLPAADIRTTHRVGSPLNRAAAIGLTARNARVRGIRDSRRHFSCTPLCYQETPTGSISTADIIKGRGIVDEQHVSRAYIALGSNMGDRLDNIEKACRYIDADAKMKICRTSALYETKPMYIKEQDMFLNGVCEV